MTNLRKPVGDVATYRAAVVNNEGEELSGYAFTFTTDAAETVTVVDAQDATVVGSAIETVAVTASTVFPDGSTVTGSAACDFFDNTPASVVVTVS